jgi:hypothetical protein
VDGDELAVRNMHSVRDLFTHWYGVLATTQPYETDITVGTTAVQIAEGPNPRIGRIISNTGTNNIALAFNAGVTISTGILLLQGQAFEMSWLEDGELLFRPMWVIGAGSGSTLHVIDNVLIGG